MPDFVYRHIEFEECVELPGGLGEGEALVAVRGGKAGEAEGPPFFQALAAGVEGWEGFEKFRFGIGIGAGPMTNEALNEDVAIGKLKQEPQEAHGTGGVKVERGAIEGGGIL